MTQNQNSVPPILQRLLSVSPSQNVPRATSQTEGVFSHPKDLFTKERMALMHKQIDIITTFSNDLIPSERSEVESRKLFFLLLITIRMILLGCFSSSALKGLNILSSLPPIVEPKRISNASRKFKSLHETVMVVLQLKGENMNVVEQMNTFDVLPNIPPLPHSYKGCLSARHHFLIHQELDKYLLWTRESLRFSKNNYDSSKILGKMFYKINKRMICAYLNCNYDLWVGLITASKKAENTIRDPNPNQNISNYAFLRGVFINGYYITRRFFGKSGPVIVVNQ